jgi:hypothetical protein
MNIPTFCQIGIAVPAAIFNKIKAIENKKAAQKPPFCYPIVIEVVQKPIG